MDSSQLFEGFVEPNIAFESLKDEAEFLVICELAWHELWIS